MKKKVMSDYTLFCTPEQTRKAMALGAPIERIPIGGRDASRPSYFTKSPDEEGYQECPAYYIPTAEQMLGWLEEQKVFIHIDPCVDISCSWYISSKGYNKYGYTSDIKVCKSRKEIGYEEML